MGEHSLAITSRRRLCDKLKASGTSTDHGWMARGTAEQGAPATDRTGALDPDDARAGADPQPPHGAMGDQPIRTTPVGSRRTLGFTVDDDVAKQRRATLHVQWTLYGLAILGTLGWFGFIGFQHVQNSHDYAARDLMRRAELAYELKPHEAGVDAAWMSEQVMIDGRDVVFVDSPAVSDASHVASIHDGARFGVAVRATSRTCYLAAELTSGRMSDTFKTDVAECSGSRAIELIE